jgi:hypothetical protein
MSGYGYTDEQLAWLVAHKDKTSNWLSKHFKRKFGLDKSGHTLRSMLNRRGYLSANNGQFNKGNIPFNKGQKGLNGLSESRFKKGNLPHTHLPVGSEVIDRDGYINLKIADPNRWVLKHRYVYEQHHQKKIPNSTNIVFLDGNKQNLAITNLIAVPRSVHARMNKQSLYQINDIDTKKTLLKILELDVTTNQKQRQLNQSPAH